MSYMKRLLEDLIDELSDSQLQQMGYSDEEISWFRECFSEKKDEG